MSATDLLHGCREVLEEVPPICHLQCVGGGLPDGLGEGHQPVTADDLGAGVLAEPGGDCAGLAIRQHVHRPGGLDVDEDRSVGPSSAELELVDTEYPRRPVRHVWCRQLFQEGSPPAVES